MMRVADIVKDIPAGKRRRLNTSSSTPSMKIRPDQFIPLQMSFSLLNIIPLYIFCFE